LDVFAGSRHGLNPHGRKTQRLAVRPANVHLQRDLVALLFVVAGVEFSVRNCGDERALERHVLTLSRYHVITLSRYHVVTLSRCHVITLPRWHVNTLARWHVGTLPRWNVHTLERSHVGDGVWFLKTGNGRGPTPTDCRRADGNVKASLCRISPGAMTARCCLDLFCVSLRHVCAAGSGGCEARRERQTNVEFVDMAHLFGVSHERIEERETEVRVVGRYVTPASRARPRGPDSCCDRVERTAPINSLDIASRPNAPPLCSLRSASGVVA
jgi:hypothetical protein